MEHEQIRIDIKRKLNSYRELAAEHRQLSEELQRLEALIDCPSSPSWDGQPRGSGVSNPVERKSLAHIELEQRYRAQLDKLAAVQAEIEDIIEGLEPTERRLARFRYIDGLTWEDVCEKMNYSWRQTHRIHSRALARLVAAELKKTGTPE
jgi:DNA-directed RNA polymerase specialized sigma24 family protein